MQKLKKTKQKPLPPHHAGVQWSKALLVRTAIISLCITAIGISGYLLYQEDHQPAVADNGSPDKLVQAADTKTYTNDYWGFRFQYPSSWWPVVGSYEEGDYFFASEPINFTKELSSDQALLEVKTYNILKKTNFTDWLTDQEQNYFPLGTIVDKKIYTLNGHELARYSYQIKRPQNNSNFWDMGIISKNDQKMYLFILQGSSQAVLKPFEKDFEAMLKSVELYSGYGT